MYIISETISGPQQIMYQLALKASLNSNLARCKNIVVELHVAQSDMGKVIGKQGRIAKAIRSVVKAASAKETKKVIVDIVQE